MHPHGFCNFLYVGCLFCWPPVAWLLLNGACDLYTWHKLRGTSSTYFDPFIFHYFGDHQNAEALVIEKQSFFWHTVQAPCSELACSCTMDKMGKATVILIEQMGMEVTWQLEQHLNCFSTAIQQEQNLNDHLLQIPLANGNFFAFCIKTMHTK